MPTLSLILQLWFQCIDPKLGSGMRIELLEYPPAQDGCCLAIAPRRIKSIGMPPICNC